MASLTCQEIREALAGRIIEGLDVTPFEDGCIISLPWLTPDFRFVEVWVEEQGGRLLVHDAGKSAGQLFVQGIHSTASQSSYLRRLASRYDAEFERDSFRIMTRRSRLADAVLGIAQCSTLAMKSLVTHEPSMTRLTLSGAVGRGIERVRERTGGIVDRAVKVAGQTSFHRFDFLLRDLQGRRVENVAVKVLRPTYGPKIEVERYGFLALDLEKQDAGRWPRLAVVTSAERWPPSHLEIVGRLSSAVVPVRTGEEATIDSQVSGSVLKLVA
jgi:hypothetical protein